MFTADCKVRSHLLMRAQSVVSVGPGELPSEKCQCAAQYRGGVRTWKLVFTESLNEIRIGRTLKIPGERDLDLDQRSHLGTFDALREVTLTLGPKKLRFAKTQIFRIIHLSL
jgi:hypothetical protein